MKPRLVSRFEIQPYTYEIGPNDRKLSTAAGCMSGFRTHLAAIRCELLSLGHTGIDHDFFELGGDSPMAVRLFARIEQSFGPKVPACGAVPARHDSVSHVARGGNRSTVRRRPATERRRPKLVADAVDWRALLYSEGLMKELDERFPIVGIQPAVDVRNMEQFRDFSTAADCFVNTLPKYQPHRPYAIGGLSHGGLVAYEFAYLLTQMGGICRSAGRHRHRSGLPRPQTSIR